jgi:hypothetical protein
VQIDAQGRFGEAEGTVGNRWATMGGAAQEIRPRAEPCQAASPRIIINLGEIRISARQPAIGVRYAINGRIEPGRLALTPKFIQPANRVHMDPD